MRATAILVILAASAVAGCLGGGSPGAGATAPPGLLGPEQIQAGGFFAFWHAGGDLTFAMDGAGDASLVLYDAQDFRVQDIEIRSSLNETGSAQVSGVEAGDLVLAVSILNGSLKVTSARTIVTAYWPLGLHVERHTLVNRSPALLRDPFGLPLGVFDQPVPDTTIHLRLLRTPTNMELLASGSYREVDVSVQGAGGSIFAVIKRSSSPGTFQPGMRFNAIDSNYFWPENARGPDVTARVEAASLDGALVLQSWSFSRALPPAGAASIAERGPVDAPASDDSLPASVRDGVAFTYGLIPGQPVSFQVHSDATNLYLWSEAADNATSWATIFGPDDLRLATVPVTAGARVQVPVPASGEHVIVLLEGNLTLGADRAPADFQFHPLDVRTAQAPASPAGSGGTYGTENQTITPVGVPFRIRYVPAMGGSMGFPGLAECGGETTLIVRQENETIFLWKDGYDVQGWWAAYDVAGASARLMRDDPLHLVHDGFGGGTECSHAGVAVDGYVRAAT